MSQLMQDLDDAVLRAVKAGCSAEGILERVHSILDIADVVKAKLDPTHPWHPGRISHDEGEMKGQQHD